MSEILVNQLKTAAGQSTLQFDSTGDVLLSTGRLGRVGGSTIEIDSSGQFVGTNAFTGAVTIGDGLTVDNDGSTVATFDRATSAGTIVDLHKDGSSMGTLSTDGGGIEVKSSDNLTFYNGNSQQLRWGTGNQLYPITDDASDLGRSTGRWQDLYLSGGVYLGGTGSANHLDDYEEGTWTPTFSSQVGSITYGGRSGRYIKVGNHVTATFWIYWTSISGNGSYGIRIENLPFTSISSSAESDIGSIIVGGYESIPIGASDRHMGGGYVNSSATTATPRFSGGGVSEISLGGQYSTGGGYYYGSISYFAA
jgi:hypothetical protein